MSVGASGTQFTNHYTGEHPRPVLRPGSTASTRQCSRTGCADAAAVTLTYDYRTSRVWLDALLAEREPHAYDLCGPHAARLSVPHGWALDDRTAPGFAATFVA